MMLSRSLIQKLWSFARHITNATVLFNEIFLGIMQRKIPQRWVSIPKAYSIPIRSWEWMKLYKSFTAETTDTSWFQ